MTSLRSTILAVALLSGAMTASAFAIDSIQPAGAPDLTAVRAKVKARDWNGAIAALNNMIDQGTQHADIYNLLGFSLRNAGDMKTAQTFYRKALDFDPDHKGALEYQGELYVKIGDLAKARDNAGHLTRLCPQGCEELEDLQKAIAGATARSN
jgi:tetratricopeptide (TPR) repeat protein